MLIRRWCLYIKISISKRNIGFKILNPFGIKLVDNKNNNKLNSELIINLSLGRKIIFIFYFTLLANNPLTRLLPV